MRSILGKMIASTFAITGPLAAALFWRDSARARSVPYGRVRTAYGLVPVVGWFEGRPMGWFQWLVGSKDVCCGVRFGPFKACWHVPVVFGNPTAFTPLYLTLRITCTSIV